MSDAQVQFGALMTLDAPDFAGQWIGLDAFLPPYQIPVMVWGGELDPDLDHPVLAERCQHCNGWLLTGSEEEDAAAHLRRMLGGDGEVRYWLKWWPAPPQGDEDE